MQYVSFALLTYSYLSVDHFTNYSGVPDLKRFTPLECYPCLLGELATDLLLFSPLVWECNVLCLYIWYSTQHTEYRHLSDVGGLISHVPRVRNTISHRIHTTHRLGELLLYISIQTYKGRTIEGNDTILCRRDGVFVSDAWSSFSPPT